jgi:MFS family permease
MTSSRRQDDPPAAPDAVLVSYERARSRVLRDRVEHVSAFVPLLVFGLCSVVAGVAASAGGDAAYEVAWAVATPLAALALFAHYGRLDRRTALRVTNPWLAATILVATVAGAIVAAAVGSPGAPYVVAAVAFVAFGVLWRNERLLVVAALGAALVATVETTDAGRPTVWLGMGFGLLQLGGAVVERRIERRQRPR